MDKLNNTFDNYMKDIKSLLENNSSKNYMSTNTFKFSEEYIDSNIEWFKNCFESGIDAYKALLFLTYK